MTKNKTLNKNKSGGLNWFAKGTRVYGEAIIIPEARVAFPKIFEPAPAREQKDGTMGKPRYEINFLYDSNDAEVQKLERKILMSAKAMIAMYNEKKPKNMVALGSIESALRDGNNQGKNGSATDFERYPYYEDKLILFACNTSKPDVIDNEGNELDGSEIKGGMICKAVIVPHLGGTGLSFRLETLQLVEDDDVRFGGSKPDYKSLLAAVQDDEDEDETEETEEEETHEADSSDNGNAEGEEEDEEEEDDAPPPAPAKRGRPSLAEQAKARAEAAAQAKKGQAQAAKAGKGLNAAKDLL